MRDSTRTAVVLNTGILEQSNDYAWTFKSYSVVLTELLKDKF